MTPAQCSELFPFEKRNLGDRVSLSVLPTPPLEFTCLFSHSSLYCTRSESPLPSEQRGVTRSAQAWIWGLQTPCLPLTRGDLGTCRAPNDVDLVSTVLPMLTSKVVRHRELRGIPDPIEWTQVALFKLQLPPGAVLEGEIHSSLMWQAPHHHLNWIHLPQRAHLPSFPSNIIPSQCLTLVNCNTFSIELCFVSLTRADTLCIGSRHTGWTELSLLLGTTLKLTLIVHKLSD